jgi:hypothetical protein
LVSASSMKTSEPPTPGSRVKPNPLAILPARTVASQTGGSYEGTQAGGNPWAAFLSAAVRQAAPAAALLGAYGMLPKTKRSSGLGEPRRTRRHRRDHRRDHRRA